MDSIDFSGLFHLLPQGKDPQANQTRSLIQSLQDGLSTLKFNNNQEIKGENANLNEKKTKVLDFRKIGLQSSKAKKEFLGLGQDTGQFATTNFQLNINTDNYVMKTDTFGVKQDRKEDNRIDDTITREPYYQTFVQYLGQKQDIVKVEPKKKDPLVFEKLEQKQELTVIDKLTQLFKEADISKSGFVNKRLLAKQILKDKSLYAYFQLKKSHKQNSFLDYYGPPNTSSFSLNEFLTAFQLVNNNLVELGQGQKGSQFDSGDKVHQITIPQPFQFDSRETTKGESIRQRKVREMIEQNDQEELDECEVKVQVNKIPVEVSKPLYQRIMRENEERRQKVKEMSLLLTKANEAPFSFYYRDMNKVKPEPDYPVYPRFIANPIPPDFKVVSYSDLVAEKEAQRLKQHNQHAKQLAQQSKLPPRMAEDAARRAMTPPNDIIEVKAPGFKHKKVPDFEKLHLQFIKKLQSVKNTFQPTIPEEFKFEESKTKVNKSNKKNFISHAVYKWGVRQRSKSLKCLKQPDMIPATTLKVKQAFELTRKKLARKEEQIREQKLQQRIRKQKQEIVRDQVRKCPVIQDNLKELEERRELIKFALKKRFQRTAELYDRTMQEIEERVRSRPLLVEMATKEQEEVSSRLHSIPETFGEDVISEGDEYLTEGDDLDLVY